MSLRKSLTRRDFARTVLVASAGIGGAVVLGGRASAGTGELDRYLDLEAVNANAEATGGLHPSLPSDSATLRSLVDTARASGVDPHRYQTLLKQYWLAVGTESAGIDLASWTPFDGVHAISDWFAKRALADAGTGKLAQYAGDGLNSAMYLVPIMLALTAVFIYLATRTVGKDSARMQAELSQA